MSVTCMTHVICKNSITDVLELVLVEEFNRIQADTLCTTTYDIKHVQSLLHEQLQFMEHY